jgi:hypothetical protein
MPLYICLFCNKIIEHKNDLIEIFASFMTWARYKTQRQVILRLFVSTCWDVN